MSQVKNSDQEFVFSDKEILAECESFFSKLYLSQGDLIESKFSKVFFDKKENLLSDDQQNVCEGALNTNECLTALTSMEAGKSPGTDGLPAEFYKFFWNDISDTLVKALNYGYEIGQLSVAQIKKGDNKTFTKKKIRYLIILRTGGPFLYSVVVIRSRPRLLQTELRR